MAYRGDGGHVFMLRGSVREGLWTRLMLMNRFLESVTHLVQPNPTKPQASPKSRPQHGRPQYKPSMAPAWPHHGPWSASA